MNLKNILNIGKKTKSIIGSNLYDDKKKINTCMIGIVILSIVDLMIVFTMFSMSDTIRRVERFIEVYQSAEEEKNEEKVEENEYMEKTIESSKDDIGGLPVKYLDTSRYNIYKKKDIADYKDCTNPIEEDVSFDDIGKEVTEEDTSYSWYNTDEDYEVDVELSKYMFGMDQLYKPSSVVIRPFDSFVGEIPTLEFNIGDTDRHYYVKYLYYDNPGEPDDVKIYETKYEKIERAVNDNMGLSDLMSKMYAIKNNRSEYGDPRIEVRYNVETKELASITLVYKIVRCDLDK